MIKIVSIILLTTLSLFAAEKKEAFVILKKVENCPEAICVTFDEDGKELFIEIYDVENMNAFNSFRDDKGRKFYIEYSKEEYSNVLNKYEHLD